jgi:hypothetical protein
MKSDIGMVAITMKKWKIALLIIEAVILVVQVNYF